MNIEQGILNVEVKPIDIQNSLFNIRYSKKSPLFTEQGSIKKVNSKLVSTHAAHIRGTMCMRCFRLWFVSDHTLGC